MASGSNDTREAIRFVLDGEVIELADVDPTRTVLEFLREDLDRTGTKEGCAEGDCGACTVVVAELDDAGGDVVLRPVNACIRFLATLDGKELITVESLAAGTAGLHPVQRAMVDCHGSQCGFCTPGFVMSLFALYKSNPAPSRRDIDDALAGNLCRCTGYRPIIAAAKRMYAEPAGDDWLRGPAESIAPPVEMIERLRSIRRGSGFETGVDGRRFHAPSTLAELCDILEEAPDATLLAGGTDVGLWVTKALRVLDVVVYTGGVEELTRIDEDDDALVIGAAVTLHDAMPKLLEHYPELKELLLRFASPPIRHSATLGGNIANGSPIGDTMPVLMVLGTTLELASGDARRTLRLDEFYRDYRENALEPGEVLVSIRVPKPAAASRLRCYKVSKRFDQDISAVCGAFRVEIDAGRIRAARVAYGGMAATVHRARHCEEALAGAVWSEETIGRAMRALADDYDPISDMRASADYRLRIAQNLLKRFYLDVEDSGMVTVYDYGRTG